MILKKIWNMIDPIKSFANKYSDIVVFGVVVIRLEIKN